MINWFSSPDHCHSESLTILRSPARNEELTPSPCTHGEGCSTSSESRSNTSQNPLPYPLPAYSEREKRGAIPQHFQSSVLARNLDGRNSFDFPGPTCANCSENIRKPNALHSLSPV